MTHSGSTTSATLLNINAGLTPDRTLEKPFCARSADALDSLLRRTD